MKRILVDFLKQAYRVSTRRACRVLKIHGSVYFYRPRKSSDLPLRNRIKEIAAIRVRYGYKRIHILLKREGWQANQGLNDSR